MSDYECEKMLFLNMVDETNKIYINTGSNSRSNEKVNYIHQFIKKEIEKILPDNYYIKLEQNVDSATKSGKKKCDIVVYKEKDIFMIFPVKYTMTSYYKNANNYWENIIGELVCLKLSSIQKNKELHIIPINLISSKIPNRHGSEQIIKNIEQITYDKSYKIYEELVNTNISYLEGPSKKLCSDLISYIIDVNHLCIEGEKYDRCPRILGFNEKTPFRTFHEILSPLFTQ